MQPDTRYARSGDLHIAYQVFGEGSTDLVIVPGFISNLEETWDSPNNAYWMERLSRFARVIAFDKRGTGLSDRVAALPNLDERMDDARAVMDAAGSERAVLLGISEGGSLAALFGHVSGSMHFADPVWCIRTIHCVVPNGREAGRLLRVCTGALGYWGELTALRAVKGRRPCLQE
jgi:pimeloyl-ACP methyl ester carboxylesterase